MSGGLTANRCYNLAAASSDIYNLGAASFNAPTLGGDIDGVSSDGMWMPGHPGAVTHVEASAAFVAGTLLATLGDGRVRAKGVGEIAVLRSLQAASAAGDIIAAVFTSGR
jgi:hypothetical protein